MASFQLNATVEVNPNGEKYDSEELIRKLMRKGSVIIKTEIKATARLLKEMNYNDSQKVRSIILTIVKITCLLFDLFKELVSRDEKLTKYRVAKFILDDEELMSGFDTNGATLEIVVGAPQFESEQSFNDCVLAYQVDSDIVGVRVSCTCW